jgi:hypothetical protein
MALLLVAGCSDGGDTASTTQPDASAVTGGGDSGASTTASSDGPRDDPSSGEGSGSSKDTLSFDGEEMVMLGSRCYFEEQDAAAGGGTILFTVEATGTTKDGLDKIVVDISRYSEDSDFAGDSVSLTVGDPMLGDAMTYSEIAPANTVSVEASSSASVDDMVLLSDDGSEHTVSFDITC